MRPEPTILTLTEPVELLTVGKLGVGRLEALRFLVIRVWTFENVVIFGFVWALRGWINHSVLRGAIVLLHLW